jgi:hypothetical protein
MPSACLQAIFIIDLMQLLPFVLPTSPEMVPKALLGLTCRFNGLGPEAALSQACESRKHYHQKARAGVNARVSAQLFVTCRWHVSFSCGSLFGGVASPQGREITSRYLVGRALPCLALSCPPTLLSHVGVNPPSGVKPPR